MGKKSTPSPPDYEGAAIQQAQSSKEVTEQQTWANRPNQITPFGREDWYNQAIWDPTTEQYINRWSQVTTLNEQSQAALDSQFAVTAGRSDMAEDLLGRSADEFADTVNWDDFVEKGKGLEANQYSPEDIQRSLDFSGVDEIGNVADIRNSAESALYERGAAHLDPRFQEEEAAMRTRLLNSGFQEDDEGFRNEMRRFNERKDLEYSNLRNDSIAFGGDEATRQFGMGLQGRQQGVSEEMASGQFGNTAAQQALAQQLGLGSAKFGEEQDVSAYQNQLRAQDISETLQARGWSLNEINAILTGQQIGMPSMPGFNTANRSESTQFLKAADMQWNADMDAFSADQAMTQQLMQGAGMGASMASDKRLKKNIQRIGTLLSGLPLYVFDFIWGEKGVGVMAQECAILFPEAVHVHPSGYLMVDYGAIS